MAQPAPIEPKPVAAAPLAFRALWAIIARFFKRTSKILNTLKKHKAPAIGFVNEGALNVADQRESRIALLRQWVDQGMMLGNHTYSHPDFNRREDLEH